MNVKTPKASRNFSTELYSTSENFIRPVIFLLSIALIFYSILRAIKIEFTIDEIQSWQEFAADLSFYPKTYHYLSANNHWFNSLLMHFSASVFGDSPFALRLPNILAHGLYLFFTAKIVLLHKRNALINLSLFILLNAHPYLLDFFSLARGYGLAIASMTAGLFYACRFVACDQRTKNCILISTTGIIAVLSNFVLLDYYVPLLFLLSFFILIDKPKRGKKITQLAILFLPFILLLMLILPHIFKMQEVNALYYGSESLWEGTAKTLCVQTMYEAPYGGKNFFSSLKPVIYFMTLIILIASFFGIRRNGFINWIKSVQGFFVVIFTGTLLTLVAQHIITHSLYPYQRTGLFILVLALFAFLFSLEQIPLKKPVAVLITLFATVVSSHFILQCNVSYTLEWKAAGGTKQFLNKIVSRRKNSSNLPAMEFISTAGVSGATINYLIQREKINWLTVNVAWERALPKADYYLIEEKEHFRGIRSDWIKLDSCTTNGNALYSERSFIETKK